MDTVTRWIAVGFILLIVTVLKLWLKDWLQKWYERSERERREKERRERHGSARRNRKRPPDSK